MFGSTGGQAVTFVRPDRWLRSWAVPDADAAWREIVRRYLRAYSPATHEEFVRWWGMQPTAAGRVLKALGDDLSEVEGRRSTCLGQCQRRDCPQEGITVKGPRLLPAFDVYVAGTRLRASLVDPRFADRVYRQAGWISPVILIDGRIAGVWKHDRNGRRVEVDVSPFGKLSSARRKAIGEEADRLGKFLDAPANVSYGSTASPKSAPSQRRRRTSRQ